MAADHTENVDLVDFFLSPENAELTEPMLLAVWTVRKQDMLPVKVAWNVMVCESCYTDTCYVHSLPCADLSYNHGVVYSCKLNLLARGLGVRLLFFAV